MKQTIHILGIVAVLLFVLVPSVPGSAGTPFEKAVAAVAVARAILQVADERPRLEDTARPNPLSRSLEESTTSAIDPSTPSTRSTDNTQHEPGSSDDDLHTNPGGSAALEPMWIETTKVEVLDDILPAQLVIGGWQHGCLACLRQKRDIQTQLTPLHWAIGENATDQIQFIHIPTTESAPQLTLYQNGIEIKQWQGYQDPAMLSRELRMAWDSAPALRPVQASGAADSIHAKQQIRRTIQCLKMSVGEGNISSLVWDRNGSRGISLLARSDWSAKNIFGTDGRIHLQSPAAKNLATKELAFSYRFRGSDVIIKPDPITLQDFADQLDLTSYQGARANLSQFIGLDDALEIYWCIQMFRDVFALLKPSVDITLPDQITANAVLNGDTLTVNFDKPVTVKLIWLFTFNLGVKRVVITETNVHIDFSGSRLVKERDFAVK